jgi:hypothetical protein
MPFGSTKDCEDFIKKSDSFKFLNVVFSFDNQELLDFYSKLEVRNNFNLALPPSIINLSSLPTKSLTNNIDFVKVLVMCRVTTGGRDNLILKSLEDFQKKIRHVNEFKASVFEFSVTVDDSSLLELANNSSLNSFIFKKVPNKTSYSNLVDLLNTATVIVLPYNPSLYTRNHSGMILISSDLQIPIVTCERAVFSDEVSKFKLGKLFNYEMSFADALIQVLIHLNSFEFDEYFHFREQQNRRLYKHFNFLSVT